MNRDRAITKSTDQTDRPECEPKIISVLPQISRGLLVRSSMLSCTVRFLNDGD